MATKNNKTLDDLFEDNLKVFDNRKGIIEMM